MIYRDRSDAGRRLATELARYASEKPIILALPRGGVVVAAEIADAVAAPLDILLVRKIGIPFQPELAMGAVVDGGHPHVIRNEGVIVRADISADDFNRVCQTELAEIERRRKLYLADRPRADIEDRVVIVVDDGIATGATVRAALQAIRERNPKRLVLAVPVAPTSTLEELNGLVDDIVCLQSHEPFHAIGLYYDDFHQVTDSEVVSILSEARAPDPGKITVRMSEA
ncbi:MAG: phosphoribosyltransferase family protein [Rhodomicrobium sp.]